jgi:lipid II:glycine glycyltransferase (peptidoglycan interpeptide bridge formation enzyme)
MKKIDIKNKGGWRMSDFLFKKYWFWFKDPEDVDSCDMLNFFSYHKVDKEGFKRKKSNTTLIDLRKDLEDIWGNMRKKFVRKQIVRGEKKGIVIKQDNNFKDFKKIYYDFRKKNNLTKDAYSVFVNNGLLFSAYYNDKMIAGGIFIKKKPYIRAWVLASLRTSEKEGKIREIIGWANRMLIWEVIKYAKDENYEMFDLGGINPNSKRREEISLMEFKESFGGVREKCYYYHKIYSPLLKFWIKLRNKI